MAESAPSSSNAVLITGGAARVGAHIAETLHAAGLNVIIHYRNSAQAANALADGLNASRRESATTVAGDITDEQTINDIVKTAEDAFGGLYGLVNNASSFYPTVVGETTTRQFDDLIGTNFKAPWFLMQAAAPALKASGGAIINLTDIYASRPLAQHPVYCAAKSALVSLTKSMARELAPEVRVNAISPGAILWPTDEDGGDDDVDRQMILSRTPLGRRGEPSDIASTARFLMLDAPFVTGQIIAVDGGRSAVP